jgi:hypothetical protein
VLAGCDPERILEAVRAVVACKPAWTAPAEYLAPQVSATVVRAILSLSWRRGEAGGVEPHA